MMQRYANWNSGYQTMVMASPNAHDEVRKMREKVHNHELRIRGSVCQLEYLADMRFLFLKGEVSSCQHSIRYDYCFSVVTA